MMSGKVAGSNGVMPPLPPKRGNQFSLGPADSDTSVTVTSTGEMYATSDKVRSTLPERDKEQLKRQKAEDHPPPPPPPPPRNSVHQSSPPVSSSTAADSGLSQSSVVHDLVPYPPPAPPRVTSKKEQQETDEYEITEPPLYDNTESDNRYYDVSESSIDLQTTGYSRSMSKDSGYQSDLRRGEALPQDESYEVMDTMNNSNPVPVRPRRDVSMSTTTVPPRTDRNTRFQSSGITGNQQGPKRKPNPAMMKRNISKVAGQIDPISETELTSIMHRRNLFNEYQSDPTRNLYINRVIKHLATNKAELIPGSDSVEKLVRQYVRDVLNHIKATNSRFDGKLMPCGSFYEGVKINSPNEFDYVLELNTLHQSQLEPEFVMPDTFKPRKDDAIRPKSYFKLKFKNTIPDAWKCHECRGCERSENCLNVHLNPRYTQEMFRKAVSNSVKAVSRPGGTSDPKVTCSGPAVTIYTKLAKEAIEDYLLPEHNKKTKKALTKLEDEHIIVIKIDITLALPWKSTEAGKWPLEGTCDAKLKKTIPRCNLVTSGDFWKVSFSNIETELVRDETASDVGKRNCFLVLKHLRDDLAITDPEEAGVLGTYPIKVTFLQECESRRLPEDWNFWHQGERTINILEQVESKGKDGTLTSIHIQNDPILMESDKCYMESRRIKQHLYQASETFSLHGKVHTGLLVLYWLMSAAMLLAAVEYYRDFKKYRRPSPDTCPTRKLINMQTVELGNFLFGFVPLAIGQIAIGATGGIFWLVYKCSKQTLLYTIYCSVKFLYAVLISMAVIHFAFGIRLAVIYQQIIVCDPAKHNPEPEIQSLLFTIMFMVCLVIVVFMVHLTVVLALAKCDCQVYCWEWVFYDRIFLDKCICCRTIRRRRREAVAHSNPVYQSEDMSSLEHSL